MGHVDGGGGGGSPSLRETTGGRERTNTTEDDNIEKKYGEDGRRQGEGEEFFGNRKILSRKNYLFIYKGFPYLISLIYKDTKSISDKDSFTLITL